MTWDEGTIDDVLLCVVRHALWQTPLPTGTLSAKRFVNLMTNADKQAVSGLVAASLTEPDSGVVLPKRVAVKLLALINDSVMTNNEIDASLQSLCKLLSEESIPYFVVKGQTVGAFYPQPLLRSAGDIDFYVAPEGWDKAVKLITDKWKPDFHDDDDGEQHLAFDYKETLYEMHYNLYRFYNKRNQTVFNDILSYNIKLQTIEDVPGVAVPVPVLSQPDAILYTFLHLYHHLVELGCGMRQFCDVAMLLNHFDASDENVARLKNNLEALGFMRAFRAVGAILVDYFGLPNDKFPFTLEKKDREYTGEMLSIVFTGGNFGFYGLEEPLRSNKKYYVKAFRRKLSRYHAFYQLAPVETRAMALHEIPHKVWQAVRGKI